MIAPALVALALLSGQAQPAPSGPDPVTARDELAAAVRRPEPGTPESTAPGLRTHEVRVADAFDPANPSNAADYRPSGAGCSQDGGALRCGTNQEVSQRPGPSTVRDQSPDTDLMGRPR